MYTQVDIGSSSDRTLQSVINERTVFTFFVYLINEMGSLFNIK